MASRLSKPFTEHPATVGESYFEHFKVAMGFSKCLAGAAGAAFVHALVPSLCEKTASGKICALHEQMTTGARAANALNTEAANTEAANTETTSTEPLRMAAESGALTSVA